MFRFPAHNKKSGCCWLCDVTPTNLRDFSLGASWRTNRLDHWALLRRWEQQGISISPIFSTPFLASSCFVLDWLHAVDQGVAGDWLGNVFFYCLPKLEGGNREQQVNTLFLMIQDYYRRVPTDSQYQDLTLKMIHQGKKGCKLRGRAAETRGLIPFALELCNSVLSNDNPFEASMKSAAKHMVEAYNNLSPAR